MIALILFGLRPAVDFTGGTLLGIAVLDHQVSQSAVEELFARKSLLLLPVFKKQETTIISFV